MDVQMKRGMTETCVLAALWAEDSYGYKIIKDLTGHMEMSESTLYPVLKRLETSGCLTVHSSEHNGRLRKYYRITPLGRTRVTDFMNEWKEVTDVYEFIESEVKGNDKA